MDLPTVVFDQFKTPTGCYLEFKTKHCVYSAMTVIQMDADCYSLPDVLAIASIHPFYSDVVYPPTREDLPSVLAKARESGIGKLLSFPLTHKEQLYCISSTPLSCSLLIVQIFTNRTPHPR